MIDTATDTCHSLAGSRAQSQPGICIAITRTTQVIKKPNFYYKNELSNFHMLEGQLDSYSTR